MSGMNFEWMIFVELGIISLALLVGTVLRAKIKFFQKFLIPNSITGGVLLLLFYTFAAPHFGMDTSFLENLVYHLLNISFVAMALRRGEKKSTKRGIAYSTSITILSVYVIQGVLGLAVTLLLIKTFLPNLFPTFGFFIPLGFALGPGQSFAIGSKWEAAAYGFEGAGSVGLTFAAIGFFWAIFGGVFLVNVALRKGWIKRFRDVDMDVMENKTGLLKTHGPFPVGAHLTTHSEAIETFSFNLAVILIVYLFSFLFLKLLTFLLGFVGPLGMSLAESFWGISFIFATLFGIIARKFLQLAKAGHVLESGVLTRMAGFSVDFMVAASIGAISVSIVAKYWVPIIILGVAGGVVTMFVLLWIGSRLLMNYKFERIILIYGALTGTLPSGLTLLRVVDPEFDTPAAADYIPAAGIMFIMAIPYILMVDFPAYAFRDNNPFYYWLTGIIFSVYVIFVLVSYLLLMRGRRNRQPGKLWRS